MYFIKQIENSSTTNWVKKGKCYTNTGVEKVLYKKVQVITLAFEHSSIMVAVINQRTH